MKRGKKNYGRRRAIVLASIYLLIGIHIAHWKLHGSTLAPLELNEVLYTIHLGIITAGFLFMVAVIFGTLIFGRFFCSWGCHILALEDLSASLLSRFNIRPKPIRSRLLKFTSIAAMAYLFIWPQVERFIYHKPFPQLKVLSDKEGWASFITTDLWRNLPGIGITLITFFVCGFLIIYLLGSRSFCRLICPYGVLFSLSDRFAPGKIKLTGSCDSCGKCTASCTSNIEVHKELNQYGFVTDPQCLKDLDCIEACPKDAISFGFTKPTITGIFSKKFKKKASYDFSWTEDIILAVLTIMLFLIFRGLYGQVPFLLSITLAICIAYMFLVMSRLTSTEFVRISNFVFKRGNRLTTHGKIFIALTVFAALVVVHSAYIQYHSFSGNRDYNHYIDLISHHAGQGSIPDATAGQYRISAQAHLLKASEAGFMVSPKINRELAYIYQQQGEFPKAEALLRKTIEGSRDNDEIRLQLARVQIQSGNTAGAVGELNAIIHGRRGHLTESEKQSTGEAAMLLAQLQEKTGNYSSALENYTMAIRMNEKNSAALLGAGTIYFKMKKFPEAEQCLLACSRLEPNSAVVQNNLAALYIQSGRLDEAIQHLKKLKTLQPGNPATYYNLGILQYRKGLFGESVENFDKALRLDPGNINTRKALDAVNRHISVHSEATALLDKVPG